ncbi:MAG: phosphatase PAP2 family protein, partial [Candidatus Aegiribacteria sp.]|nr:phosphatase PAP2 family protein [Candidatus Aegiribacteria sp.]MBD3294518.1 phosphatase PAP2 family protein [Candidatus Fermentibacteria bacterium]
WAGGSLSDSPETEETGQMLTEGLLISYSITGSLKLLTHRERPDGSSFLSFPSGHSSGTACCAVILWDRYGPEAGIPAAVLAVFSALSRVQLGRHYPSDVIAGSAIGLASGLAVIETRQDREGVDADKMTLGVSWSTSGGLGVYF